MAVRVDGLRPPPDLSALPPDEAERARAQLYRLDHACGCALGSSLALVVLGADVALLAFVTGWLADSVWISLAVGAGVFVLAAGAGKALGLMRARQERDRLLDELHWRIATAPAAD